MNVVEAPLICVQATTNDCMYSGKHKYTHKYDVFVLSQPLYTNKIKQGASFNICNIQA